MDDKGKRRLNSDNVKFKIPVRYNKCIWCMRPLNTSVTDADNSPTDEHIFPESIFGAVITRDCCKGCNSRLGSDIDLKLLADERVFSAAREAGITENELLVKYSGIGFDSENQQAQYTVKHGKWRLKPRFHQRGFKIGLINGEVFPKDIENAKAKMRSLIEKDKSLQLTTAEKDKCIEDLFDAHLAGSGKNAIYWDKIKQGLFSVHGPRQIKIIGCYRRYETEWAVAKILYETTIVLLPPETFAKVTRRF